MSQKIVSVEEAARRWNPHTGLSPDPTLPDRITITCGKADRWGKCRFVAKLNGERLHNGLFDPYSEYHRGQFAESVYTKADGVPPDESVDLRWLGYAVIQAAESAS